VEWMRVQYRFSSRLSHGGQNHHTGCDVLRHHSQGQEQDQKPWMHPSWPLAFDKYAAWGREFLAYYNVKIESTVYLV
jgi:hypothetical protein